MARLDARPVIRFDPAADPDHPALERQRIAASRLEQLQGLGCDRYREIGAPVGAEIEIDAAPHRGGVGDAAFDDLEAADVSRGLCRAANPVEGMGPDAAPRRSEEHTSELQSLMRISYAVFCLKKKN